MSDYYRVLKYLSDKNRDERMPCTKLQDIQQWYAVVLQGNYSSIKIFAKDLSPLKNEYMVNLINSFLYTPWNNIQILLKEDCDLSWLPNKENLLVKIAAGSYAASDSKEFTVVDDRCFRFEAPQFGIINFNNKEDSAPLVEAFDMAFAMGTIKKVINNE